MTVRAMGAHRTRAMLMGVALMVVAACGRPTNLNDNDDAAIPTNEGGLAQPGNSSGSGTARPSVPSVAGDRSDLDAAAVADLTGADGSSVSTEVAAARYRSGAEVAALEDFSSLAGKRVGLIVNQASVVHADEALSHLVDAVSASDNVTVGAIFGPEHGFRGGGAAGASVGDAVDPLTGAPIYSLYGDTNQPTAEMLDGLDALIFDLQDVGLRYYTYGATLGLAMQAAAANNVEFVVFDRPVPAGAVATSGALRDDEHTSFVSLYPIPTNYALTSGELALAIKGEGWLEGLDGLSLRIVEMQGWERSLTWADLGRVWTPPSPGLATFQAALTYPALVQLEATTVSFGQGTDAPFQQFGAPWLDAEAVAKILNEDTDLAGVNFQAVTFTPHATGSAPNPRFESTPVPGVALTVTDPSTFDGVAAGVAVLGVLRQVHPGQKLIDRSAMFDLLAGTSSLRVGIASGETPQAIVAGWASDLEAWETIRRRYLRYS